LNILREKSQPSLQTIQFQSIALGRDVRLDVYLPPNYAQRKRRSYPFVLFNDGQDLLRMSANGLAGFGGILEGLYSDRSMPHIIAIGIHTSAERIREYGVARQPDYKGRGDKAGAYNTFIVQELLPFLNRQYRISEQPEDCAIAGFSLGGLSAFDIGWANPDIFGTIGVFSGALWWRSSPVRPEDPDADRIMHDVVQQTAFSNENQCFWFQCGTLDEEEDRNNNGVIDAIDDTLDLIKTLRAKGVHEGDIRYHEMEGGRHDPETWGAAMEDFLRWGFVAEGDN
jgi:iron(III)-enterobactin esterase